MSVNASIDFKDNTHNTAMQSVNRGVYLVYIMHICSLLDLAFFKLQKLLPFAVSSAAFIM